MADGSYVHLNRDGRWPGFSWTGLDASADGTLTLARVPLLAGGPDLSAAPAPDGPAGVAAGPDGRVYFTDPSRSRLLWIDPCSGTDSPVPCWSAGGEAGARLRSPRGLALHPLRSALAVADSGNHRVLLIDTATLQLLAVWGQPDVWSAPTPGSEPGRFDTPTSLAFGRGGELYVVDSGNRRVQKLGPGGAVVASFWDNASAAGLQRPVALAVGEAAAGDEVYVLDAEPVAVHVFDAQGTRLRHFTVAAGDPLALAIAGDVLLLGDNARRRLLVLRLDGAPVGEAEGFRGPVAGLAGGGREALWLHPGGDFVPLHLEAAAGFVRSGVLWGGPLGNADRKVLWHELRALGEGLPAGAHLQFFVRTGPAGAPPPAPGAAAPVPFDPASWTALPVDALRGLVRGAPAAHLWVGVHLSGEGRSSARLAQVRVDYDPETYSRHLPAIFKTRATDPDLLERFLALFQSAFTDVQEATAALPRLFDPWAAPASWLVWLAGWLGIELDEAWPEEKQRQAIARAWSASGRRGTSAGLREAVSFATGIDVRIVEPVQAARWIGLGDGPGGSRLGFDSHLAPAELDGAVLGTTALLGGSFAEDLEGPGAHLYGSVAHRFCVHVYERQVASPARLERVRAVIDREKPAHTAYQLSVIAPRLRVGLQARVGVDAVVAGGPGGTRLGGGSGLVLGGAEPGRVGRTSRVGIDARLGEGAVFGCPPALNRTREQEEP
jgi:phage tail-like protein